MTQRKKLVGHRMRLDEAAASRSDRTPAFLTPPEGAPAYHGFPILHETLTDRWCYGVISDYENPEAGTEGDGFVVAPDGSRAGIVWSVGEFGPVQILKPDDKRWGVYELGFPRPVRNLEDVVHCFRSVLPALKKIYAEIHAGDG